MLKTSTEQYPPPAHAQWDMNRAIVGLYNCWKYLEKQGFKEHSAALDRLGNLQGIRGAFMFPDGSGMCHKSFQKAEHKDLVLEKMISEGVEFKRPGLFAYGAQDRRKVIRTTLSDDLVTVYLSLLDTTKETTSFPLSALMYTPQKFAVGYQIDLEKDVIIDQDLVLFERYAWGLHEQLKLKLPIKPIPEKRRKTMRAKPVCFGKKVMTLNELVIRVPQDYVQQSRVVDNRYKLERLLGVGATSYVHAAIDLEAGEQSPFRNIAIKVAQGEDYRLRKSAKNVSSLLGLQKKNIAKIINISHQSEKEPYVVMELEEGATLDQILEQHPRFEPNIVFEIIKQVAQGLHDTKDIMPHLDIKPGNIFITLDGTVKLLDFGLKDCTLQDGVSGTLYTKHGQDDGEKGTLFYRAPEVKGTVGDSRSDLFSIGTLLYHLLTGYLPESSDSINDLRPDIPTEIDEIYKNLTKRDPAERLTLSGLLSHIDALQQKYVFLQPAPFSFVIKEKKICYQDKEAKENPQNILQRPAIETPSQTAAAKTVLRPIEEVLQEIKTKKIAQLHKVYAVPKQQEKQLECE